MNFQPIRELAEHEAGKATGSYVVPSKDFQAALLSELCKATKLKPADPATPSPYPGFAGEKKTRISAIKAPFAEAIVGFLSAELEAQIQLSRGITQIEVSCHNTVDNDVNEWGDSVLLAFRLR